MKLNDQIFQFIESLNLPADVMNVIRKFITDLESRGAAPGLEVGDKAPGFSLPNAVGQEVSLKERLNEGPVVLSFYRGEWCPFCNLEVKALQDYLPSIQAAGASLIAISPQLPSNAMTLTEKHGLTFDVLSDATQKAIREYKLQFTVPEEVKEVYTRVFKLDVAQENADGSWNLPVPATFILDRRGIVRACHVSMNYMIRMEPEEVLMALNVLE